MINNGTLSAADGQVILAAGREVGFAAHSQDDASLRGLDVFVGKVDAASGTVSHLGWIDIPRGNATLTGKTINQSSVITSSTSVSLNGSVDLLANYNAVANPSYDPTNISLGPAFVFVSSGAVTLGPKSVTRILPEWDSLETAVGTQLALPSRLKIQGLAIHLENQSSIFAPNANATLTAGNWNYAAAESTLTRPTSDFINASGQLYFEPGATINVAGSSGVSVSVAQNILTLQLRGAELADSPVQRDGILRGITLNLDIRNRGEYNGGAWIGTPLGDATGFAGLIQRTVGELTTAGGSVTLKAGSSIVMQPGSTVDSSGGFIDFQGGLVETTRVTANGRLYDISQALPDRIYDGIYTGQSTFIAQKYGIAETFTNPLALKSSHYEAGYIQGASGGKIAITAPSMALDGTLIGQTVSSDLQRSHPPVGSELAITFQAQQTLPGYPGFSPTPPSITFATSSTLPLADAFALDTNETPLSLREERQKELVLSPELFTKGGFARLTVSNGDGDIVVPAGLDFHGPVSGKLTFEAANITIGSDISAPGGALSFTAYNISPTIAATLETATPPAAEDRGLFNLAAGIKLSTAGLIVDERNPGFFHSPLTINGGSIAIKSFSANLPMGSALDVSGGVVVSSTGKRTDGTGGSLSVIAGRDPSTNAASVIGGTLVFDATLSGFGGSKGGSLTVQAQSIQIGGIHALANTLHLAPDFFNTGGFTSFTLTGIGSQNEKTGEFQPGLTVTANTVIQPVAKTWLATFDPSANDAARLVPILLPEGLRPSVSLSLNASGATDLEGLLLSQGDLVIEKGALIEVGPQASVAIKGKTVSLLGSIVAPGGRITVSADGKYPVSSTDATALTALPTLYLGADSLLSTKGMTVYTPDAYGRRTGSVLAGGNISIAGNIVADHGAILDVSGASGVLDLAIAAVDYHATRVENSSQPNVPFASGTTSALWNLRTVFTHVESDAGSIAFTGAQELFIDATLLGNAGGSTALGGSLDITSGRFYSITDELPTPQDTTLVVTQNDPTRPVVFYHPGESPLGSPVLDQDGMALAGLGHFSVNTFANSGMDSLTLQGNVQFHGNVRIDARRELSVASQGVLTGDGAVRLTAGHVTAIPLSAGGQLDVYASVIHQNGVLRAPLGIINLGRDESTATRLDLIAGVQVPISQELSLGKGSITSVSAGNLIIPYGISSNGTSFIDPFGNDISTSQIPAKNISLASQKLTISKGSTIDISGGGDLYAYRFNKGNGGSSDLLGWNFAGAWNASVLYGESSVVSYQANHAPYAPFSNSEDPGYTTAGLNVGDRVWLGGSETLQEGTYTLLPARYALLPGAVLVTPQAGTTAFDYSVSSFDGATQTTRQTGQTVGAVTLPEGANFGSGYRYNDVSGTRKMDPTYTRFEVASNAVVRNRASYEDYLANSFLKETGQRLPGDAGHLILQAMESMILQGRVLAQGQNATSRAGLIDIASSSDISITDHRKPVELEGILTLNAASLGSFGAESLLIGGIRTLTTDADGNTTAQVRVTTGSGDGVLLRLSSDPAATITRHGYSSSSVPQLTIGAGSRLTGASLILDSTAGMSISPAARLQASSIALDSGQISVLLGNTTETPTGLVLTGSLLAQLRRTESLALLSYSSIDTYGTGIFKTGGSLSLHAGEIRGFDTQGGEVVFAANDISLDNSAGAAHLPSSATTSGQLTFQAANIRVGENTLHLDQFASVALNARQSIVVSGQGGINAQGSLLATTPVVVAESGATILRCGALHERRRNFSHGGFGFRDARKLVARLAR